MSSVKEPHRPPQITEAYRRRPVRCLDVAELDGWRIKIYGIAYQSETPDRALVDAALGTARRALPSPATSDDRYGVGFLGIHEGRASNFVFVDWWAREDELHHLVWFSASADPGQLMAARRADAIACVWDLRLLAHERDAWVGHALSRPGEPDLDGYLADQMNADV